MEQYLVLTVGFMVTAKCCDSLFVTSTLGGFRGETDATKEKMMLSTPSSCSFMTIQGGPLGSKNRKFEV
ncbi:conserved hypothetical protein [Ricinus communis]|uniref:Uncharacterized protein n=1 Tax=Ricinus communis TaxID=3988 RepID=B9SJH4_RICCO|nr:conserved hypothetical protein [Ricinus communis]